MPTQQPAKPADQQPESGEAPEDVTDTMAQAFKEIAKGEQTATAMENKLSTLEQRIDSLLDYFERHEAEASSAAAKK